MRLRLETVLVVCLCLWIPVVQSYGELAPEDQDGSGDDEFSGSGSGDDDIWLIESEVATQASPNTTKPIWYRDGPVIFSDFSVTADTEPETSGRVTEAPFTTQITETQPSPVIIKSFGSEEEDHEDETTTISNVDETETTVPPAEELPVVPMHEEEYTTTAYDEETEESSVIDQEEDKIAGHVEAGTVTTETPDMETTPLPLTTTSSSIVADPEASGDSVESTTVQVTEDIIEKNIIPGQHEPKIEKPKVTGNDFEDFEFEENEIKKSKSRLAGFESDFAQGSSSGNDNLLERKEVLAGVIAGGVVGLAFAIMLVALMVYRMKKKDEGSYSLDEHKHPNGGYQKPQKQEEFLA